MPANGDPLAFQACFRSSCVFWLKTNKQIIIYISWEGLIHSDGTDGLNNYYYALAQTSQKKSTHYTIKPSTQEKQLFFRLNILNTASNEDLSRVEKGLKMITSLFPMNSSL